jgi:hypothetical protein
MVKITVYVDDAAVMQDLSIRLVLNKQTVHFGDI